MAKLKAYNQIEVHRFEKENDGDGIITVREKKTFVFMSNGRILKKLVVWFKPNSFETLPRYHDYGFKLIRPSGSCDIFQKHIDKLLQMGYIEVSTKN